MVSNSDDRAPCGAIFVYAFSKQIWHRNRTTHNYKRGKMRQIIFKKLYIIYTLLIPFSLTVALVPDTGTSALSYQSDVGINFTFNPTLSVSISPSDLVIPNLTPGTTDISNEISINVSTNNIYGYNLYATVGNSVHNNTNLTRSSSNDVFASISTTADLPNLTTDNTWGYTYSLDNGTTWSNYNGLPLYTADNPIRLKKNTGPAEDTINFKIAAKSSTTQPSGAYSNAINFTAITKPTPITLADAYAKEGKELYHGYYKMQDMAPTICEETEDIGSQLQVIDTRDNKVYWIAKLADNNCWMTQNLDLDLTSNPNTNNYIALTSENTDLTDAVSAAYQDGYTISGSGVITWVPERDAIAYNNLNSTTWQNDNNHPYSYDYLDKNGNSVYPDGNATQQIAGNHGLSGNYYNWSATVASNDSSSASGTLPNSICSKGWKLPNIVDKEFGNLFVKYRIASSNAAPSSLNGEKFSKIISNPLYFIRAGRLNFGGIGNNGQFGDYWTSTLYNNSTAYYLNFSSTLLRPQYSYEGDNRGKRGSGWSIRCLAR